MMHFHLSLYFTCFLSGYVTNSLEGKSEKCVEAQPVRKQLRNQGKHLLLELGQNKSFSEYNQLVWYVIVGLSKSAAATLTPSCFLSIKT